FHLMETCPLNPLSLDKGFFVGFYRVIRVTMISLKTIYWQHTILKYIKVTSNGFSGLFEIGNQNAKFLQSPKLEKID
ncbi:MAG: hypothetical protein SOY62_04410, partial [Streptococcus orisratti]|nr:hypothetical protein [Streptococcus orisratti]